MGGEGASGDAKKTDPNFMGVALKGWAVFAVSLLVVAFAAGHFGFKLYDDWQEDFKDKAELADKVKKAAAINQDTSAYSNAITKEMDVHRNDGSGHHVSLRLRRLHIVKRVKDGVFPCLGNSQRKKPDKG